MTGIAKRWLGPLAVLALIALAGVEALRHLPAQAQRAAQLVAPTAEAWSSQLLYCALVTVVWGVVLFVATARRQRWQPPLVLLLLASAGWGMLLLLTVGRVLTLGPVSTLVLVAAPVVATLIVTLLGSRARPGPPASAANARPLHGLARVALIFVAVNLVIAALWLPLRKPPATGDETYFWWSSSVALHAEGWTRYLETHPVASYEPAYPVLSSQLLFFIPARAFSQAMPVMPFLYGAVLFWLLLGSVPRNRVGSWTGRAMLAVVGSFLFLAHDWIYRMTFELWYGEALAIIALASLFYALDRGRGQGPTPSALALLAGLGALCQLSKPPLSFLLLPFILPFLALCLPLERKGRRADRGIRLIAVAVGALIAKAVWASYGLAMPHLVPPGERWGFDLTIVVEKVLPYWRHYPHVWAVLGVTVLVGLPYWRRLLPYLGVALGMVLAVLALYATLWRNYYFDHESSGRFLLHGTYGWALFFFATRWRLMLRQLRDGVRTGELLWKRARLNRLP